VGDCLEIDLDSLRFKKNFLDESTNGIVRKISSATDISDTKKEIFRLQMELAKKKEEAASREASRIKEEKTYAIEQIEKTLGEKKIKPEELEKYSNYQEQINNLSKV